MFRLLDLFIAADLQNGRAGPARNSVAVDEIFLPVVSTTLRKLGFSVSEAADGTAGANLFRANQRTIDVVLLDLTMPGMSGPELFAELRRIQPGVRVILMTAFGRARALSSIGGQPTWGYLRKPFEISQLASLLREALNDPKHRAPS